MVGLGIVTVLTTGVLYAVGIRINTTCSGPVGLWRTLDAPIERGSFVLLCATANRRTRIAIHRHYVGVGSCPGRTTPLLKRVVGLQGDVVKVTNRGIWINGERLHHSARQRFDTKRRRLPHPRSETLPAHMLWLMNDMPQSFDSRYFGKVSTDAIKTPVEPLLTWTAFCPKAS